MIRTICAVLMLMCTLPCLAGDDVAPAKDSGVRQVHSAIPPGYESETALRVEYGTSPDKVEVRWADLETEEASLSDMRVSGGDFYFMDNVGESIKRFRSPATFVWRSEPMENLGYFDVSPSGKVYAVWGTGLDRLSCLDVSGKTAWTKRLRDIFPDSVLQRLGITLAANHISGVEWTSRGLALATWQKTEDEKDDIRLILIDEKENPIEALPGRIVGSDCEVYRWETGKGGSPHQLNVVGVKNESKREIKIDLGPRIAELTDEAPVFQRLYADPTGGFVVGAIAKISAGTEIDKKRYTGLETVLWRYQSDGAFRDAWRFGLSVFSHGWPEVAMTPDGSVYYLKFEEKGIRVVRYHRSVNSAIPQPAGAKTLSTSDSPHTGDTAEASDGKLVVSYLAREDYPPVLPENGYIWLLYDVKSTSDTCPLDAVLTLSYAGEDLTTYGEENYRIFFYDPKKREWSPLETSHDFVHQRLSARISSLGVYAVSHITIEDVSAPYVDWITPEEDSEISGQTELFVAADDNVGLRCIEFYLANPRMQDVPGMDPQKIGEDVTDMDGQWSIDFDFSDYAPGKYILKAVATDASGNSSTAVRQVTLNTSASAPRLTVDKPHYDDKIGGVVLTGTASDADGDTVRLLIGMIREGEEPFWLPIPIWPGEDDKWGIVLPLVSPGENQVTVLAGDEHNITSTEVAFTAPLYKVEVFSVWPLGPQLEGAEVSLTGRASGGKGRIEYKFEVSDGTGWTTVRDYATEPSCTWITGRPAKYTLRVTARDQGDPDSVFTDECKYTIAEPLSGVSLSAEPAGPQPLGAQMLLTATPVGGVDPVYEVEVYDGQKWTPLPWEDEWDGECKWNQWFWKPDSPGTYTLRVTADERETTAPTFSGELTYTITPAKGKDGKR